MNQEQFKKIIRKSTIETSEGFVDKLMGRIEKRQETEKKFFWWSFRFVLIVCVVLLLISTFCLFKLLGNEVSYLSAYLGSYKTPVFITVILILLYGVNTIVRFNRNTINQGNITKA